MGKTPCEKDKLASLDMRSEKTPEQDLRSEVGMKSREKILQEWNLEWPAPVQVKQERERQGLVQCERGPVEGRRV